MELSEVVGISVGIVTLFSAACAGVWWLISIAIAKGDAQAQAISSKIDTFCGGIAETMHTHNAQSIERHEQYQRHIDSRIDGIEEKADRAMQGVSHLENQFNYLQGRIAK